MRPIFTIIILSLAVVVHGQIHYLNYKNAYYNKSGRLEDFCEPRINEITLNSDSTFEFWSRPFVSCFTWHEYKGSWKKVIDTIRFYDNYEVVENDTRTTYKNNNKQVYHIGFSTDKNSALISKDVKVQYVYDYDAHLEDIEKTFPLRATNSIEIPFPDIPNRNKLAAIRIEYQLNDKDKRYCYLSENSHFLNVKTRDLSNIISVKFVENPKKEVVHRVITGIVKNDTLRILSIMKSKTTLPDYHEEIMFEDSYAFSK
ncbi:MAG: hypothetical protein JST32_17430 [Bacteroidetes bacterium]|nr:hypothetical protein [Bacteroidota bacterium]